MSADPTTDTAAATRTVVVNGEPHRLPAPATVRDLVTRLGLPDEGVAVAVNSAIVPASTWDEAELADGAAVEILTAVQGG